MNLTLLIALLAFFLGAALNRGSTCAVLATEQLLLKRRPARFLALFECALWAVLCLAALGCEYVLRPEWMSWALLVAGSALFGLGAVVNGACAFGVVGRIGSGQVEYLLTGVGLFAGLKLTGMLIGSHSMMPVEQAAALPWQAALAVLIALAVVRYVVSRQRFRAFMRLAVAMAVVGTTFVALGQLHQPFPWVAVLSHLPDIGLNAIVAVVALLAGSAANAMTTGRGIRLKAPTARGAFRRLFGGCLMGAGVLLVPGGNDGVLLYGMPAGEAEAFAAYAVMVATIGISIVSAGKVTERWRPADLM